MATPYYVKAYYTKQSQQQPEIRRFAIDIASNNDIYQELCTKVATYQPEIQLNGFLLQYVDEENERITFSSNDELRAAIAMNNHGTTLKIFVVSNQPTVQQTNNENQEKECHNGVICDGCQGPVVGSRYKCLMCPNYDLCERCSLTGIHSEHNMMKISKPSNAFHHPYAAFGHHGRHHRHRHGPGFKPSFRASPELMQRIQSQIPQWLPNRENTAQFRTHVQTHIDTLKSNAETQVQNSKQYLESVGQYLQQTLSPFGIDCEYRVDGQPVPPPTTSSSSSSSSSSSDSESASASAAEPSAVPKTPPAPTNEQRSTDASVNGISSWLNMIRIPGMNTSTPPPSSASSSPAVAQPIPSSPIRNPVEKSIDDCIELMKSMGFDEQDQCLITLIREKNGDVNQVLDAINTHQNCQ